jgi:nucleoside-diphosphate-sugar epimerase
VPRYADRVAGVDYAACDIAEGVPAALLEDVAAIVHCAAETAGGASDQRRNSIEATRKVIEAAHVARIKRILHISSLAVLRTDANGGGPIDENTALVETLRYGPYVWGKAGSERLALTLGREYGLDVSVIRLGPLVDYRAFQPPGRLGREMGPLYIAVGPRKKPLSMCSVETAARVIRLYVDQPEGLPSVLNLVEPAAPTRAELVSRLQSVRSDLRVFWVPFWLLRAVSPPLKLIQRLALGSTDPVDISSAFASNVYATELAGSVIGRATHRDDAVTVSAGGAAGTRQTA